MKIFIDTNILLSFYHLSSDDLEELKKLAVLVRQGKAKLYLPEQVLDEFRRNRAGKIADALKRLRDQQTSLQVPQLTKQYEEYGKLRAAHSTFSKRLSQIIDKLEKDASLRTLDADSVIEELISVAEVIPTSTTNLNRARNRMDIGNPPGKKGSLGDAIIWEALLCKVRKGQDLFFISDDGDFYSPLDRDSFDPFLAQEWWDHRRSRIHPYNRMSAFFRDHFPNITLAAEMEKDILIDRLSISGSFAETNSTIVSLSKYFDFTQDQVNRIVEAAVTNNQVYWIARDQRVHSFVSSIVVGREELIEPLNLRRVRYFLDEIRPYGAIPF